MIWKDILLLGVGYLISEVIRRINRAESFSAQIFNRRLDVFAELYNLCDQTYTGIIKILDAIHNNEIDATRAEDEHYTVIMPLLNFLDKNALFISDELCVQCGASFLLDSDLTIEEYDSYRESFTLRRKQIKTMIENESGMTLLNKNIKSITRHNHKSDIVDYFKHLKREHKKDT